MSESTRRGRENGRTNVSSLLALVASCRGSKQEKGSAESLSRDEAGERGDEKRRRTLGLGNASGDESSRSRAVSSEVVVSVASAE